MTGKPNQILESGYVALDNPEDANSAFGWGATRSEAAGYYYEGECPIVCRASGRAIRYLAGLGDGEIPTDLEFNSNGTVELSTDRIW